MGDGTLYSMQNSGSVPMSAFPGEISIGFQLDHFAKIFYSTILSDLGQAKGPNILSDRGLMQEYAVAGYSNSPLTGFDTSTPAEQAFNQLMTSTGNLTITPSTFYSQYICQVPHRRNMGSVIIVVLVADLVFLQALFKLLTYTTTWWLKRTDKIANFCEGCQRQLAQTQAQPEGVSLLQLSPMGGKLSTERARKTPHVSISSRATSPESPGESAFGIPRKPGLNWQYDRVVN